MVQWRSNMKYLIVKSSSLGDIIHSFPVLDYLREKCPEAQIDWVVEASFAELVRAHPSVDRVICVDTKKWRGKLWKNSREIRAFRREIQSESYDLAFDLQGNVKSGLILSQTKAKKKIGFGWKTVAEWPNGLFTNCKFDPPTGKNIREDYLYLVQKSFGDESPYQMSDLILKTTEEEQKVLSSLLAKPQRVLVCPGAAWPNKQLSYETLVSELEKQTASFFFAWGTEKERALAQRLCDHFGERGELLDCLSLPLLQNLMRGMDLVVAMDSLPLHLAGTTPTATLSFFGPSSAKKYAPIGDHHYFTQGECPYNIHFEKRCPKLRTCATGKCLKN